MSTAQPDRRDSSEQALGDQLARLYDCLRDNQPIDDTGESSEEYQSLRPVVELLADLDDLLGTLPTDAAQESFGMMVGKYRLSGCLGMGGQSVVLLARDTDLDRDVVLKWYRASLRPEQLARIEQEGRALASISSDHVAKCYALERHDDVSFLAVEFVDGEDLDAVLATQGCVDPLVACDWIRQVALGLEAIHAARLIHRDLKPSNVVVGRDGKLRLVDLGLAELSSDGGDGVTGTYAYMSPEQARGEATDARSDIYGLGAVLYAMLVGKSPLIATDEADLGQAARDGRIDTRRPSSVPNELWSVVIRCLQLDPASRFSTAMELLDALDEAIEKLRGTDRNAGSFASSRRRPGLPAVAVAGVTIISLVTLLATLSFLWMRSRNETGGNTKARTDGQMLAVVTPPIRHGPEASALLDRPLDQQFPIQVRLVSGGEARAGRWAFRHEKPYKLRVAVDRDCYLQIYSWEAEQIVQLYPYGEFDGRIRGGVPIEVPALPEPGADPVTYMPFRSNSDEPEYLYVVASTVRVAPLPGDPVEGLKVIRSDAHLAQFDKTYRGTRVLSPGVRERWVSEVVIPYDVE